MPQIYVDFKGFENLPNSFENSSKKIGQLHDKFTSLVSKIDWDVKSEEHINATANKLGMNLDEYSDVLKAYASFLSDTKDKYQKLDQQEVGEFEEKTVISIKGLEHYKAPPGETKSVFSELMDLFKDINSLEELLEAMQKTFSTLSTYMSSENLGFLGDVFGYFNSLIKMFTEEMSGLHGVANWCGLFNGSTSLFSGLQQFIGQAYNYTTGIFSDGATTKLKIAKIAGDVVGLLGECAEIMERKDSQAVSDTIADVLFACDDIPKIIRDVKHLKTGPFIDQVDVTCSLVAGGLDIVAQAARSTNRYYSDGNWTFMDTVNMLYETSASGTYGLFNTLTYDMLGWLSQSDSPEDFGENLKNWSYDHVVPFMVPAVK